MDCLPVEIKGKLVDFIKAKISQNLSHFTAIIHSQKYNINKQEIPVKTQIEITFERASFHIP